MLTSCKQEKTGSIFIIPPDTIPVPKEANNSAIPPSPPPNRAYYFPMNFIIDTAGQVFFYQKEINVNDDEIRDWNTPPNFINLYPESIAQIPANSISEFVELNVLNMDSLHRYVMIASEKDTVNSLGLSKIISACKDVSNHIRWKFRKITQEESIVLDYKKRNRFYLPESIKWDSTKIRMPISFNTQN